MGLKKTKPKTINTVLGGEGKNKDYKFLLLFKNLEILGGGDEKKYKKNSPKFGRRRGKNENKTSPQSLEEGKKNNRKLLIFYKNLIR